VGSISRPWTKPSIRQESAPSIVGIMYIHGDGRGLIGMSTTKDTWPRIALNRPKSKGGSVK
jgi:hypothetical protein